MQRSNRASFPLLKKLIASETEVVRRQRGSSRLRRGIDRGAARVPPSPTGGDRASSQSSCALWDGCEKSLNYDNGADIMRSNEAIKGWQWRRRRWRPAAVATDVGWRYRWPTPTSMSMSVFLCVSISTTSILCRSSLHVHVCSRMYVRAWVSVAVSMPMLASVDADTDVAGWRELRIPESY